MSTPDGPEGPAEEGAERPAREGAERPAREGEERSEPDGEERPEPGPARLDPDRAIQVALAGEATQAETAKVAPPRLPSPVIDTRRYQWMIGGFGLLLLFIFSVYLYAHNGSTTPGVAPGKKLHYFVAPLATDGPDRPANANPHCNPAHPASRGLNVCGRKPIVIAFFALGAGPCERQVDALQTLSTEFPKLQFAAVAVDASLKDTRKDVRAHHWTIPVAFDSTGLLGQLYGVSICPMLELAGPGGVVSQRLIGKGIGDSWEKPAGLAVRIKRFAATLQG